MRAIVIGGGIGGPVAATALHRVGIEAIVHEAHDGPAESLGLFLGLAVNGMRVLHQLDLLAAVMSADTIATPLMAFSSTTGKQLGIVSNGWLDANRPSITLMRGALQRALADEARSRGIELPIPPVTASGEGTLDTSRIQMATYGKSPGILHGKSRNRVGHPTIAYSGIHLKRRIHEHTVQTRDIQHSLALSDR